MQLVKDAVKYVKYSLIGMGYGAHAAAIDFAQSQGI
jgi:hypothetical protein